MSFHPSHMTSELIQNEELGRMIQQDGYKNKYLYINDFLKNLASVDSRFKKRGNRNLESS